MTATDTIRAMLDERGVEWHCVDMRTGEERSNITEWNVPNAGLVEATELGGHLTYSWHMGEKPTPEQAIEATLGQGTCRDVRSTDHTIAFECSECGCWVAYDEYWETGIYVLHETGQEHIHPHYCPNCGRRVEQ